LGTSGVFGRATGIASAPGFFGQRAYCRIDAIK
jgi:hypothetical protein